MSQAAPQQTSSQHVMQGLGGRQTWTQQAGLAVSPGCQRACTAMMRQHAHRSLQGPSTKGHLFRAHLLTAFMIVYGLCIMYSKLMQQGLSAQAADWFTASAFPQAKARLQATSPALSLSLRAPMLPRAQLTCARPIAEPPPAWSSVAACALPEPSWPSAGAHML